LPLAQDGFASIDREDDSSVVKVDYVNAYMNAAIKEAMEKIDVFSIRWRASSTRAKASL